MLEAHTRRRMALRSMCRIQGSPIPCRRIAFARRGSIHAIVPLPLLDVKVRVLRSLFQPLVVARLRLDLPRHERRELFPSLRQKQRPLLGILSRVSREQRPYLELLQVRHGVGPHFVPLDDVSSVLCVSAHGARPVALVEAAADVLGRELEVAVAAHGEGLRRSHGGRFFASARRRSSGGMSYARRPAIA